MSKNTRTAQHNIISKLPGLRGPIKKIWQCPSKIWDILFTDNIINEILVWTNIKIDSFRHKYKIVMQFYKKYGQSRAKVIVRFAILLCCIQVQP